MEDDKGAVFSVPGYDKQAATMFCYDVGDGKKVIIVGTGVVEDRQAGIFCASGAELSDIKIN